MNRKLLAGIIIVAACGAVTPLLADDEALCLDCHEPAEDWEGLSSAEIFATSQDTSIKRHKELQGLSEEQIKAIITELLPTPE